MRLKRIGMMGLLACLLAGWIVPTASRAAAPEAVTAQPTCDWGYYSDGQGSWVPLYTDPEGTTPSALRFGSMLSSKATQRAKRGGIDFNNDGKADIFRIGLDAGLNPVWQMVTLPSAPQPLSWITLRAADNAADPSTIWFGDFNRDGQSDIFYRTLTDPNYLTYTWYYVPGGGATPVLLGSHDDTVIPLAVGDFNGDGYSDIFSYVANSPYAGAYRWQYYSGGAGTAVNLAYALNNPFDLRFGDFNGDNITDVFAATPAGNGQYQWMYSSGGLASYQNLALTNLPVSQLSLGDFDGDGITDVFSRVQNPGETARWQYWPGGSGAPVTLRVTDDPMPFLADLDNDRISDAFLARCSSTLAFREQPAGENTQLDPGASYAPYALDLNADKATDLLWISLYQNKGTPTNQIWASGVLSNPATNSYTNIPNQVLDTNSSWSGVRTFPGDFDGNSSGDLIINRSSDTVNDTRVVRYGPGGFAISPLISLGGMPGLINTGVGDFSGDGRTDLIWGANCINTGSNCIASYPPANTVAAAMSSGSNLLLAPSQTFPTFPDSEYFGQVLDVNGDGKDDLVYTSGWYIFSRVYVALSNGNGSFNLLPVQDFGLPWHYAIFGAVGDFNGDGKKDLVVPASCTRLDCAGNFAIRILYGSASGQFQASGAISLGQRDWYDFAVQVADINHDGRDDLVWVTGENTNYSSTAFVMIDYANADGTFTNSGLYQVKETFRYTPFPLLGDFNGDGRKDLMWVNGGAYKPLLSVLNQIFLPLTMR